MNRKPTILRHWLATLLAAVLMAAAPDMAWGQTNQGVRVKTATGETSTNVKAVASTDKDGNSGATGSNPATTATASGDGTLGDGTIITAGNTKTVTVTTTGPRMKDGKMQVAKVTVMKIEDIFAEDVSITGIASVNQNSTTTLTANVTPTYAKSVVWTVSDATTAAFVSGSDLVSTLTTDVNVTTGTATVTLKGLVLGTTTVSVKATGEASTELANRPITVYTAPTKASNWSYDKNAHNLISAAGTVLNGTMYYKVDYTPNIGDPSSTEWSTDLPTATNAGTYRIYCKSETDLGYTGCVEETELGTVTVNRVNWTGSVTVEMGSKCHNYDLGGGQSYDTYWWIGTYNRSGAHSDGTITKWEYCNWLFRQSVWSGYNNANNTGNSSPWIEEAPRWRVTIGADNNHNQTQFEHTWTAS